MTRKDPIELAKMELRDRIRTAVRLEQRVRVARELNDAIADAELAFDAATHGSTLLEGESMARVVNQVLRQYVEGIVVVDVEQQGELEPGDAEPES